MHNVEPFRIETTRERLAAAVGFANAASVENRKTLSLDGNERLDADIKLHADEMKAIYITLRVRGIEEADFFQHVGELKVDDILIAVENSPTSEDEVIAYTIADIEAHSPAV
jgi:hypothetical protein